MAKELGSAAGSSDKIIRRVAPLGYVPAVRITLRYNTVRGSRLR